MHWKKLNILHILGNYPVYQAMDIPVEPMEAFMEHNL